MRDRLVRAVDGPTPTAVAKSGAEGGRSEQNLRNRLGHGKWSSSDGQKRAGVRMAEVVNRAMVALAVDPKVKKKI